MRNRWQKILKHLTTNEYILDFHLKIRKEVSIHHFLKHIKSQYFNISILFSNNLCNYKYHFQEKPEYYSLSLSLLPACWFLICRPTPSIWCQRNICWWLSRQLQPQPKELYRGAERVPLCRLQSGSTSAHSAAWDRGSPQPCKWQGLCFLTVAITVGLVGLSRSSIF